MTLEFCVLSVALDQEELAWTLQEPVMLFSMILIGILPWISKLKIGAIELARPEMSRFTDW